MKLGKHQRLSSTKDISQLFEGKQAIKEFPFILYYNLPKNKLGGMQIAFGLNRKKGGNAVRRNKVKRIMREAFRKLQDLVNKEAIPEDKKLALMLIYTGEKLPELPEAEEKIKLVLKRLNKILKAQVS